MFYFMYLILHPLLIAPDNFYHNIYKGALGEVVGWLIFKNVMNVELKQILDSDVFEVFDYKVNDDIYVDFKHWKETYDMPNSRLLDKINLHS